MKQRLDVDIANPAKSGRLLDELDTDMLTTGVFLCDGSGSYQLEPGDSLIAEVEEWLDDPWGLPDSVDEQPAAAARETAKQYDTTWNTLRRFRERYLLGAVVIVIAFGVFRWDWHLIVWEWLGETNGGETNSATFRNFGLIFLPVVAIYLTWKRIKIAAREAHTSRLNLTAANDALRHSEKTLSYTVHKDEVDQLHGRYADASARLSSASVSARLGAIYELRDLTDQDPEQLHVRTMKLLCAFVRLPPPEARLDEVPDGEPCSVALRPDIQAAMEVIGSRTPERIKLESDADYMPDLQRANLVRLELHGGNLSGSDMRGSRCWGANLIEADLSGCRLQHAEFTSPWVLRGVELGDLLARDGGFYDDLEVLQREVTYMTKANFSGASMLSAKLPGARLSGADMSGTSLPNATLSKASLEGVDFSEAQLAEADMSGTTLASADLNGAKMLDVNLSGTDLRGSSAEFSNHRNPPVGLTQAQLDDACADLDNPPKLDPDSGLVWNPKPCTK